MVAPRSLLVALSAPLLALALLPACGGSSDPGCVASAEICNGRDDDCDGVADEGFDVGAACTAGVGACAAEGHLACALDGTHAACDAVPGPSVAETCNQLDDDCDGQTDEALAGCCVPAATRTCGVTEGVCAAGTETCSALGAWGPCLDGSGAPVVLPGTAAETCDGADDDCDGETDEGFDAGAACSAGTGACERTGARTCLADGSGTTCGVDPGAPSAETCNGVDDDCDGQTDEELTAPACPAQTGVCAGAIAVCAGVNGWAACGQESYGPDWEPIETMCDGKDNDCDGTTDEDLQTTVYRDADFDGFGAGPGSLVCTRLAGWSLVDTDCDDARASVKPGATEVCNGTDDDCDGAVDEDFGVGTACTAGVGACLRTGALACDGPAATACTAQPGAPSPETCNGIDDDCNGAVDESLSAPSCANQMGVCAGSKATCGGVQGWLACGPTEYGPYYQAPEASCDGRDNDCDGTVDENVKATYFRDADADGYGNSSVTTQACSTPAGYVAAGGDCNDATAAVYPGATETCNGVDDNCDSRIDEGFPVGNACTVGVGACVRTGLTTCAGGYGVICDAVAGSPSFETCNGVDDDCNGSVDDSLSAPSCPFQQGVCAGSKATCGGVQGWLACGPTEYGPYYQAPEASCDGRDNDCDGAVDEGLKTTYYRDADADGFGVTSNSTQACGTPAGYVTQANDCNDAVASVYPGAIERCNGVDDDCDGATDETFANRGGSCVAGVGECERTGTYVCKVDGTGTICDAVAGQATVEVCADGKDNDCDGQTDEGDCI